MKVQKKNTKLERVFQANLIKELKKIFKGCIVLKVDGTNTPQGFPDLVIIYKKYWAALEVKKSAKAHKQPNQEYWVDFLNRASFSRFIYPENKEEVLNDLRKTFRA